MKNWGNIFNIESKDGTWEITHHEEDNILSFQFWNYENQGTEGEKLKNKKYMFLTYEQANSLIDFIEEVKKRVE